MTTRSNPGGGPPGREEAGGFGCDAFGHLAGPYVDGELASPEAERLQTHLDSCRPCQRLVAEYRAIDLAARSDSGRVPTADEWSRAWTNIEAAVHADRHAAAEAPLAGLARFLGRGSSRPPRWIHAAFYAAAAVLLVGLTLTMRPGPIDGPTGIVSPGANGESALIVPFVPVSAPAKVLSLSCLTADSVPVVYTTEGEDSMTVVQCTWVGDEPPPAGEASGENG